ncbi:MAG: M23 family metallopeptidase [Anaerolineales bacterium]|nr:M23 family metallopeptidase [Anaerolineales bacterium]
MKNAAVVFGLAVLLLVGCSPTTPTGPPATAPGPTLTIPEATPTETPVSLPATATPTMGASIPCAAPPDGTCILDGTFLFQRPISAPGTYILDRSYPYGSTMGGARDPHHGVEFQNASGTPVLAAAAGIVTHAGNDTVELFSPWSGYYGNLVVLEHRLPASPYATIYTLYAHLSSIEIVSGQAVAAGEQIGAVGLTGTALGSHLHFEVRLDSHDFATTLNPDLWLAPTLDSRGQLNGAIAIRILDANGNFVPAGISLQLQGEPGRNNTPHSLQPYAPETINLDSNWYENAAMGDLPAGGYRIAFVWGGTLHERRVTVEPGRLTLVVFQLP